MKTLSKLYAHWKAGFIVGIPLGVLSNDNKTSFYLFLTCSTAFLMVLSAFAALFESKMKYSVIRY